MDLEESKAVHISKAFPQEAQTWLSQAQQFQKEGRTLAAIRAYQKGLIALHKAKSDPSCSPSLASEIKNHSRVFIQSLNTCIERHASLLDFKPLRKDDEIVINERKIPCGEHCNQVFKASKHRENHLLRVEKTSNDRTKKVNSGLPISSEAKKSRQRSFPSQGLLKNNKRVFKVKSPLCDMAHEHIFFSETFKTIEAAHQFMIDSGLRTLYRTRSSNSISAIYVCKHSNRDYECKKKKKTSECNVSIKISTKLISRSQGRRFFIVSGCLNHNHDIKDSRLSPAILKLMRSIPTSASRVLVETRSEPGLEPVYIEGQPGLEHDDQVIVEYESDDGGVKRTEIYFPFISTETDSNNAMSETPQYVQEITLVDGGNVKSYEPVKRESKSEWVDEVFPCDDCSKVFFDEASFSHHKCSSTEKEFLCTEKGEHHEHQYIDRKFDSMEAAIEYVRSQELHVYFLEQFKRKDFIVYQCSKGVHPDKTSIKNDECPATFTIKTSSSKYVLQGCLTHNHQTQPQLLKYLTKSSKRTSGQGKANGVDDFDGKKEYATNLLIGTIKYIKGLSYSATEDKTVNAIIKGTTNAVNPHIILGDLPKANKSDASASSNIESVTN